MRIKLFHRRFDLEDLIETEDTVHYIELAYEFTTDNDVKTGIDTMTVDEVFWLFNSYPYREGMDKSEPDVILPIHRYFSALVEYRNESHRSLSIGDVVQIEDCFFEVRPQGWRTIIPVVSACGRQLEI